jgi:RNA-directed DNA polymerase
MNWRILPGILLPVPRPGLNEGQIKVIRLFSTESLRIERHTKIRAEINPYDPAWEPYAREATGCADGWNAQRKTMALASLERAGELCPVCHQKITKITGWHSHHVLWRSKGGSDRAENRVLLHPPCHL